MINKSLRDLCPDIQIIYDLKGESELEMDVLDCINERYIISIDGEKTDSDFIFYHYAYDYIKLPTFFMIVPLNNIDNGKHILNISKINLKNDRVHFGIGKDFDKSNIPKAWEEKVVRVIPFYLQID